MTISLTLLVIVLILLCSMFVGTPVAFALGFAAAASVLLFMKPSHLAQFANIAFIQTTSTNLLVVPLFVLMAEILAQGGIAKDIFTVLNKRLHRLKGGLAISATLASTIFAALCGSSPATAASIGRISIEAMQDADYDESFSTGVVAAGGTLGIMIPPSLAFVMYGILTEMSITKLLMAGLLPGILISLILILFIVIRVKLNPKLIASSGKAENGRETDDEGKSRRLPPIWPPLVLIVIVLGSIYSGIATPTEAAAIGCAGAFLIVLIQRRFTKKVFTDILLGAMKTSAMIIFLTICGLCLSYVISYLKLPQTIAASIIGVKMNKWIVMILVYIMWLILGCLMDPNSMIVLTIPFLYPTLKELGFDPIWLGVVTTLCIEIGMITPPVGMNLFVLKSVSTVPMLKIIRGSIPYVILLLFCLAILSIFPGISLLIPNTM